MKPGDRVRVDYPPLPYHGRTATVEEIFDASIDGHDLGELVALRLDDGSAVGLPPEWLVPVAANDVRARPRAVAGDAQGVLL